MISATVFRGFIAADDNGEVGRERQVAQDQGRERHGDETTMSSQ